MVFDYKTNESFIKDNDTLLQKLIEKDLWNKDTLVIGVDKSVRPVAYTMRKLSKLKGIDTPPIRFVNYSSRSEIGYLHKTRNQEQFAIQLKKKFPKEKISNFKQILILDEYMSSGHTSRSLFNTARFYFSNMKAKDFKDRSEEGSEKRLKEYKKVPEIYFAWLRSRGGGLGIAAKDIRKMHTSARISEGMQGKKSHKIGLYQ